jgi:hypothetical protein
MPKVIATMNRFGHLTLSYKTYSIYVQFQSDIESYTSDLSKQKFNDLENGWPVKIDITDEEFDLFKIYSVFTIQRCQLLDGEVNDVYEEFSLTVKDNYSLTHNILKEIRKKYGLNKIRTKIVDDIHDEITIDFPSINLRFVCSKD